MCFLSWLDPLLALPGTILTWVEKNPTTFVPFCALLTSLSSLFVSVLVYRRDTGRLLVSIGVWDVYNPDTGTFTDKSSVRISIVNYGRRPIAMDGLGGYNGFWRTRKFLNQWFPRLFDMKGTFFMGQEIARSILDESRRPRVITEGQRVDIYFPYVTGQPPPDFARCDTLWISDTAGKNHYVPPHIFEKFKKDVKRKIDKK